METSGTRPAVHGCTSGPVHKLYLESPRTGQNAPHLQSHGALLVIAGCVFSLHILSTRSSTSLEQTLMRSITLILSTRMGNTQNLRTSKKPLLESQDAKRSQKCLTKLTHSLTRRERRMSGASAYMMVQRRVSR